MRRGEERRGWLTDNSWLRFSSVNICLPTQPSPVRPRLASKLAPIIKIHSRFPHWFQELEEISNFMTGRSAITTIPVTLYNITGKSIFQYWVTQVFWCSFSLAITIVIITKSQVHETSARREEGKHFYPGGVTVRFRPHCGRKVNSFVSSPPALFSVLCSVFRFIFQN